MSSLKKPVHTVSLSISAFLVGALSPLAAVDSAENPFRSTDIANGYMLAEQAGGNQSGEAKCGEGKCGGKSDKEAVCGMYQVGSPHQDDSKVKDGKCGGHKAVEALCGGDR
jgi:uncharacterized low-complexity protein